MDERLRRVARRLDGEKMALLRREFGISRKTGYKIFNRYKECGLQGLTDRSELGESLHRKTVTQVSGINPHPSDRNEH